MAVLGGDQPEIDLNGVFAYVDTPGGRRRSCATIHRRRLAARQPGRALDAAANRRRGGVRDHQLARHPRRLRAGPLTVEQMFNVFPFENSITSMYLSGTRSRRRWTSSRASRPSAAAGRQAQVSGITFDMVCTRRVPGTAQQALRQEHLPRRQLPQRQRRRPIDPKRCAPLVPTGLYRVAVNDYIARGGSGFDVLKRNTSKQDTGVSLRDALRLPAPAARCGERRSIDISDPDRAHGARALGAISCLTSRSRRTRPHPAGVRVRPLCGAAAPSLAALARRRLRRRAPGRHGHQSLEVELVAPAIPGRGRSGSTTRRATSRSSSPRSTRRARSTPASTREVDVYAQFLGSADAGARRDAAARRHLMTDGLAENDGHAAAARSARRRCGSRTAAATDPTFATGTSPTLWYRDPFIVDMQRPRTRRRSTRWASPLENKQIRVSGSRYGATRPPGRDQRLAQGYTVSDVECATGRHAAVHDRRLRPRAGLHVHRPRARGRRPVEVGDVIEAFAGGVASSTG